jgi:hypothetical protein
MNYAILVSLLLLGSDEVLTLPGDYQTVPARPDVRPGLWVIESVQETVLSSDDAIGAGRYVIRNRSQFCRGGGSPPAVGWLKSPDGRTFLRARTSKVPNSSIHATTEVFSGDFNRQYTYFATSVLTEPTQSPGTPISTTTFDRHTWLGECPSDMAIDETRQFPRDSSTE